MDNKQKKKKFFRGAAVAGVFFTALAAVWFGGLAFGKNIFAAGGALAVSAWGDMFHGGTDGSAITEIGFPVGDDASTTVAPVLEIGSSSDLSATVAAQVKKNIPAKKSSSIPVPPPTQWCGIADASSAAAAPASSQEIIFNEVAWMGSLAAPGEDASHASGREWIELKNNSAADVDLAGWQLLDGGGNIKITFADGDHIPGGSFYLLARDGNAFFAVPVDKIYSGTLPNAGDELALFGPQCTLSDVFDVPSGWPAGNNTTKQTMERDADGAGWHTSAAPGGTPRVENSVPPAAVAIVPVESDSATATAPVIAPAIVSVPVSQAPSPPLPSSSPPSPPPTQMPLSPQPPADPASSTVIGHLMIVAVQIGGASSSNDFVKIMNPTAAAVDVSGWKLRKKSSSGADYSLRTFPDAIMVAPGAAFVWANSEGGFSGTVGANVSSTETLAADNSVALFDENGSVVDEVAWGTGTGQYVEGSAYPTDPAAGQVLARNVADGVPVDTDNNATDFTLQ